jgi:hypothetical protein
MRLASTNRFFATALNRPFATAFFSWPDRQVCHSLHSSADSSHLNELGDPDLLGIGVVAEHEMGGEVLLEDCQASGPSTFGRMKHARSWGVEEHCFIVVRYASYMSYRKFAGFIQPRLDWTSDRFPSAKGIDKSFANYSSVRSFMPIIVGSATLPRLRERLKRQYGQRRWST